MYLIIWLSVSAILACVCEIVFHAWETGNGCDSKDNDFEKSLEQISQKIK